MNGVVEHLAIDGTTQLLGPDALARLQDTRSSSIVEDDAGRIWLGHRRGLIRVGNDGAVDEWGSEDPNAPVPSGQINHVSLAPDDTLWLAGLGGGVQQRDTATGNILRDIVAGDAGGLGAADIDAMVIAPTGDPWVGFISTTASGGFNFCDVGPSDEPHPDGSRVWLRPYRSHRQGRPYWDRYANEIDFERLGQIFSSLRTAASDSGAVVWNARRILLQGDRLLCLSEPLGAIDTVSLREIDLVYLPGFSNVLIKSVSPVESPLTARSLASSWKDR